MSDDPIFTKPIPVATIRTPPMDPDAAETIQRIMREHGGNVVSQSKTISERYDDAIIQRNETVVCIYTFPVGTTKEQLYPIIYDIRYKITFPDGFEIFEYFNRTTEESNLHFPLELFPEELQEKHRRRVEQSKSQWKQRHRL